MNHRPSIRPGVGISRREWLAATLAGWSARASWGAPPAPIPDADDLAREIDEIQVIARKAGLGKLRHSTSRHYLGIGNAPDIYRLEAIGVCEELADEFFRHFGRKGFALDRPRGRLTIVTLADQGSYLAYQGVRRDDSWGTFQPRANRVLVFDLRTLRVAMRRRAERENLRVLVHEATHQLTSNSLMLDRAKEQPSWLVEGIASYCEWFKPGTRPWLGGMNRDRLDYLIDHVKVGGMWLDVERLIMDDRLFQAPNPFDPTAAPSDRRELAYAQSWLLVDYCLNNPTMLPRFRAFLKAANAPDDTPPEPAKPPDPVAVHFLADGEEEWRRLQRRFAVADQHLGALPGLDVAVRRRLREWPYYRGRGVSEYGPSGRGSRRVMEGRMPGRNP